MHYGLSGGIEADQVTLLAELAGVGIISEDVDFSDRFKHILAFGAQLRGRLLRPAIFYKFYLNDDLSDVIDGVLGFKLDISLK